jgi:hypothetical protein
MMIAQALKVSNDSVKVVYIVSQVPWNHPLLTIIFPMFSSLAVRFTLKHLIFLSKKSHSRV